MAQTTTNYGLLKPESTDSYNHLIYDNPNMDTIDAAMKANANAAIDTATCIKSGTTHTITRTNTSANVFKFTATGDWNNGDTMIVDGVTVTPYLVTGEALKTGAYLINTEVLIALSGSRATVFSNQSEAGSTYFDDTNVSFTANNVEDAIEELNDADNIKYNASMSVKDKIDEVVCVHTFSAVSFDASGTHRIDSDSAFTSIVGSIDKIIRAQVVGVSDGLTVLITSWGSGTYLVLKKSGDLSNPGAITADIKVTFSSVLKSI